MYGISVQILSVLADYEICTASAHFIEILFWWLELLFAYIAAISCLGFSRPFPRNRRPRKLINERLHVIPPVSTHDVAVWNASVFGTTVVRRLHLKDWSYCLVYSISETDSTSLFETPVCWTCDFIWVKLMNWNNFYSFSLCVCVTAEICEHYITMHT